MLEMTKVNFDQDVQLMEERYQGKWDVEMKPR